MDIAKMAGLKIARHFKIKYYFKEAGFLYIANLEWYNLVINCFN